MTGPRIGSLFSGYGGLEQGVQSVLGGTVAWHSEIDPGACKILAHRYSDVPNLGDITAVDWSQVEPVDVLVGGFPCQDVSSAGLRKGLRPDTRSGLWAQFAHAINQLRPQLVVIENVRGLLSAEANCDVEPCPWCVGDADGVLLRALGAVLGDLADIRFDAEWQGVQASDVGAPHERFRAFVAAWPIADAGRLGRERAGRSWNRWDGLADDDLVAPDSESHRRLEGRAESARIIGRSDAALGSDPAAADSDDDGRPRIGRELDFECDADGRRSTHTLWGDYEPAIRRWEDLTRPAPPPRESGGKNGERLSPRFVEWMQGLPDGWVTGPAIWDGMTDKKGRVLTGRRLASARRDAQLKALGNGVVPQQAAAALRLLLPDVLGAVA